DRRFVAVQQFIDVFLPTVRLDSLIKITLKINKTDANQGNPEIAGFFAMIAGKDSKSAQIDRQRCMDTELSKEVNHRLFRQIWKLPRQPFVVSPHSSVQALHRDVVFTQKIGIARSDNQSIKIDRM